MNANLLRRVSWLWKHRHTHDDDPDLQTQITVIRQEIEGQGDVIAETSTGAYIHLTAGTQTVDAAGEAIEWDTLDSLGLFAFTAPPFPATAVTIEQGGYYNIAVAFDWATHTGGGTVWIVRTRSGLPETIYPLTDDPVWSSTIGSMFVETAHAIPCVPGDQLEVWVDPGASSQDIAHATLSVYLVDRVEAAAVATTGLVDAVASYDSVEQTEHIVTMTSAQSAGDMMLMFLVSQTFTWAAYPSGWTTLIDNFQYGNVNQFMSVLYRVSDGTESNVTADTSSTCKSAHAVWVVQSNVDYSSNPPTAATPIKSTTPTIDPPAVTPSQGAGNYMIYPIAGRNGGNTQTTDGPDGYDRILDTLLLSEGDSLAPALEVYQAAVVVATSVDPTSISWDPPWINELIGSTTIAVRI